MRCTPSISAVIPAYNSAEYISDAIESIREQTRPVEEIIIVDDGSTDSTADVVEKFGDVVRYIRQDNSGPSTARNHGIQAAHGDLIAFLDADDQWIPSKIERQLAIMQRQPDVALVAGDMAEIDLQGNITVPSVLDRHHMLSFFSDLAGKPVPKALALLLQINFIPTGTVLVNRKVLEDAGGFDTDIRYGEDLQLWTKIAAQHAIVCLPDVLMLRRQHGQNATQDTGPLLSDLVKVMASVRMLDKECLRDQTIDPDRLVAQALGNLGYWHFASGRLAQARHAFSMSLKEKLTLRALSYRLLCLMPDRLVYSLRQVKQRIARTG